MRLDCLIIETDPAIASVNMEFDQKLLDEIGENHSRPILHLYEWERPSATYGYFTDPTKLLNLSAVNDVGLQLARRPTGGGIIFHVTDFAFSLLIPNGHEGYSANVMDNYHYVNCIVVDVIHSFLREFSFKNQSSECQLLSEEPDNYDTHSRHFCMAKPTKYDVMIDGKKVGGAAQRRTKNGFLHQGSISLAFPDRDLLDKVLLPHTSVLDSMLKNSYSLLPSNANQQQIAAARLYFKEQIKKI